MKINAIKTSKINTNDSLELLLKKFLPSYLQEETIIVISSKIISLCQGRVVKQKDIDKRQLIRNEADWFIDEDNNPHNICLTIKDGVLIPTAGIDESNANGYYILYPANIQKTAFQIWQFLSKEYKLNCLGVIISDSHTTPLRRGVVGIALGWCGFAPLYSYINKPDIYGRPLAVTQINCVDALAVAAVLVMGEGNEQTPLAIINNAPKIEFITDLTGPQNKDITISLEEDLYGPLLLSADWQKANK